MKHLVLGLACLGAALTAPAQSWTNYFNGPGNGDDFAKAIAVDKNHNVFVTGTAKGGNGGDYFTTIKYSNAGLPVWTNLFAPLGYPKNLSADSGGNVIVTGKVFPPGGGNPDLVTIKYSSSGAPLWTNYYGYVEGGVDTVWSVSGRKSIAVDHEDNVIVACESESIAGDRNSQDVAVIKYSKDGAPLWTNRWNGPDHTGDFSVDTFIGLQVDLNGSVILTTQANLASSQRHGTIKYSSGGVPLWTNYWQGIPGIRAVTPEALGVDAVGNVVVSGIADRDFTEGTWDIVTTKYAPSGALLWTKVIQPVGIQPAIPYLAVDSSGAAILSARETPHWFTLKLSPSGSLVWSNRYEVSVGTEVTPSDIAVDNNGSVYVTGVAPNYNDPNASVSPTIKYSSDGVPLWTNLFAARHLESIAIVADNDSAFWAGPSWNGTSFDFVTIKYAPDVAPAFLNVQRLGNNAVLSWTEAAFGLQSAPAITGTFTNVPGALSPYTNALSGGQRFFRLAQ